MFKPITILLLLATSPAVFAYTSLLHGAVDLAYNTRDGITVTYPAHTKWMQTIKIRGEWGDTGIYFENNDLTQGEHAGTHMDSPSHFIRGGKRIHEIPLERFSGEAVVVDITEQAKKDRDATMKVEDLLSWEKKYGRIPNGAIVVMYSGWGKFVNDTLAYLGVLPENFAQSPGGLSNLHSPGFSQEAAEWLVKNRNINGVAVDTVSLDNGPSDTFPAHVILLGADIWGIENMANVDKLRPHGDTIFAIPYNIHDGSGAPIRAFALPTEVFQGRKSNYMIQSKAPSNFGQSAAFLSCLLSVLAVKLF